MLWPVKLKKRQDRDVKVVGFEAEAALRDQLNRLAAQEERSRSWVIRRLLLRALAQNEKTA